jgi:dipeptidyl aminopeptidase/acylaminoacyl peptidase
MRGSAAVTLLCSISILGLPAAATAQEPPTVADYERSLGLRRSWAYLTEGLVDQVAWLDETHRFVYRTTVPGGFSYKIMDADTGEKRPAFDHERLAAALGKATGTTYEALKLPFVKANAEFGLVDEGKAVVVSFDDHDLRCSLDDYVCSPEPPEDERQPRGFGVVRDSAVPADNRPKVSPDGKLEAQVRNFNVAFRPVGSGAWQMLSTDGSEGDFYDPDSIVWSPDSLRLAAYRVLPGFRREITRVVSSPPDQLQPTVVTQLYPKPGDRVDIDRPVIFEVAAGRQIVVPFELFPSPYRMSDLEWRKDGAGVRFEYTERGHQRLALIEADAATGKPRVLAEERAATFVNTWRHLRRDVGTGDTGGASGAASAEILWSSERDGWNHLYLVDARTGSMKQITRGAFVVRDVIAVDPEKRQIVFVASGREPGQDPYFQHYYRIDFDGRNLQPITTAEASHVVSFSADRTFYVDLYSRVDLPPVATLHRADGTAVSPIETADISRLNEAGFRPPEVFVAKGRDGATDIWGLIVRPRNFDPSRRYPVIENIYAGPHDSFVSKTFSPLGFQTGVDKLISMQALADLGFVVVQMDGMGTANRSKAFHDVTWKNLADSGFPDRILWHRAAAAKYPWYDIGRVGIYGGSAGGQSTLSALLFHGDFYKVGVAFAGCFDNRMDKISWNEQWMGWPVDESYAKSSGVDNAWRLKGKLLLINGEQDANVDPASTMQVVNALIKANKEFDLLLVPNGGHAAARGAEPLDYGNRRLYDFFLRHLAGQPTPDWNALER